MQTNLSNERHVTGMKQVTKAIARGEAMRVFIASDADEFVVNKMKQISNEHGIPIDDTMSMAELGRACKIDVAAATAAVLKD
ncbi:MAG: ribosomal L7Ae/L30e/S12e/Gadd45 family protein [Schwartzia sp.]|nr:ribosomal L7Ae/L30e/S12e/Gadd45 family protein [Schwartzia sp. (in: firmicutes)]